MVFQERARQVSRSVSSHALGRNPLKCHKDDRAVDSDRKYAIPEWLAPALASGSDPFSVCESHIDVSLECAIAARYHCSELDQPA